MLWAVNNLRAPYKVHASVNLTAHLFRSVVRQLGKPALLAATYKGDASGIAAATMEEVEAPLVNCLHELERLSLLSGGNHIEKQIIMILNNGSSC